MAILDQDTQTAQGRGCLEIQNEHEPGIEKVPVADGLDHIRALA